MVEFSSVGKRVPKLDALEKATGRAQYIQDIKLPGMLYGKILYSKYPHARIAHIDVSRAKRLTGVRAILTGEDAKHIKFGVYKDNTPLKAGKVRSYRDEVAAVAQTLDTLLAHDVAVSWPDISEPWSTLRLVRANRPVSKPASQAPSTAPAEPDPPSAEVDEAPEQAVSDDSGDDQP